MGAKLDSGGGKKGEANPEMNITPLIDVVLVLLIIFMVMTPMMIKQFSFQLPEKEENSQQDQPQVSVATPSNAPAALVLQVTDDLKVKLNDTEFPSEDALKAKLAEAFRLRQNTSIFFDASDKVPYQNAIDAMDLARSAGATSIAVVTERKKVEVPVPAAP